MIACTSCGSDVIGKKFCPRCGTAVQPTATPAVSVQTCPQCNGEVKPGAAFCMHCGASLRPQVQSAPVPPPPPSTRPCSACNTEVAVGTAFCTNCGHDMRVAAAAPSGAASTPIFCTNCGRQNAPGMHFCAGCGNQLSVAPGAQPNYAPSGQYTQYPQQQYPQYPQPQYQQPYAQSSYPQQQYPQQYVQGGYQPQPMLGQPPMVLRCPTCMAMAPLGTPACVSCHTSLAGVVPVPENMPMQGQAGGLGGFMQGNAGKYAMGALGGAAAVIGGEMLFNGVVDNIENRIDGDRGYGEYRYHHREEGLLGGLGELADDIGL